MPQLPSSFDSHPARDASLRSMEAVEAGDRETWLSLFGYDSIVEDPIGVSPFDPEGHGHRGIEAIAGFYDTVIAPNTVRFRIDSSFACGNEVANVGRISTTLPDGSIVHTDGVFTYRLAVDGKVASLRAFWELDNIIFEAADA